MNLYDIGVVVIGLGGVRWGQRSGLRATVALGLGLAAGLLATQLLPRAALLLPPGEAAARGWILDGAFFLLPLAGLGVGGWLASRNHAGLPGPWSSAAGAFVVAAAFAGAVWLVTPPAPRPGLIGRAAYGSATARLVRRVPRPPFELADVLVDRHLPALVRDMLARRDLPGVPSRLPPMSPADRRRAEGASVQVIRASCGGGQGSGFAITSHIVVTNAHVVAGSDIGEVELEVDGRRLPATVVGFDPDRDIAFLYAPALSTPHLDLAPRNSAGEGELVATVSHPDGQPALDVSPARVFGVVFLPRKGIYGKELRRQTVLLRSSALAPGSSGGAVVDGLGRLLAIVFAGDEDSDVAFAVSSEELRPMLRSLRLDPVHAGRCAP